MNRDNQVMVAVAVVLGAAAWLALRPRQAPATQQWVSLPGGDYVAPGPSQQLPGPAPVPTAEPGILERAGTWFRELVTPETVETAYRTPAQWRALLTPELRKWENHYGLPEGFLAAIAEREAAFRHDIITGEKLGGVGEKGLMQIWPKYHPDKGCSPLWSIEYAAGWFRDAYNRYQNWDLAIMAWNWGSGNMEKYGVAAAPPLTKDYIAQINRQVDLT